MTYPIQIGFPQIILFLIAAAGLILLISMFVDLGSRTHRRPGGLRLGRGIGGIVLFVLAVSLLWLTFLVQSYLGLTGDILVAHVHATKVANAQHTMSVELILYDKNGHQASDETYQVLGDEWVLQGDIVKFPAYLNALGLHSGYKLTRLEGRYDDLNLERHAEHTAIALNGGDDTFFQTARQQNWMSPFVEATYGNAVFQITGTYNVYISQTGLFAKPA